jgi:hypothetical protein
MTVGLGTTTLANKILDHLRGGTAWTQPAGIFVKLHTADPGAAGATAAAAGSTTRARRPRSPPRRAVPSRSPVPARRGRTAALPRP